MDSLENIIKYSKGLKLLYVEDNQDVQKSTCMVLKEFFDEIILSLDGKDGLDKFKNNDINLVITDINMPKLNGLDMIGKIREIDADVPILVLSAYNKPGYFMQSIKLGVEGYLLKPIEINQLLVALGKIVEKLKLKKALEDNIYFLKQYQEATNYSSIVSKTDINGVITFVNDEFCKISEYSADELVGNRHNIVRHPENPDSVYKELWDTIQNKKQVWTGMVRNISKSGKSYYLRTTIKPILDTNNNVIEYIALRDDITDIMSPKKQLHDLVDSFENIIAIMIKIDHFEDIEKFYGLKTLQKIEDKLGIIVMDNKPVDCEFEKVFSLGNGEFVFAKDKNRCKVGIVNMIANVKKFQENINDIKIDIGDVDYDVSVIMSLSYGKDTLENIKIGIKKLLDTNQDFIIANGFAQIEHEKAEKNMQTISMVKTAIDNFNIVSYFQPIINNRTGEIDKYESLVRLIDEKGEVLSPFFFLDTAKKGKYYSQITSMVLNNSFEALKKTDVDISINISALDIERKTTRRKLFELLESNKEHAKRVVFELLEDENVKDFKTIREFIRDVKKLGVKIAIDDFGAGYSNFERLLDYQPDILKIDGCLIKDIETNSYSLSVVKTIVAFAIEQNIQTIAEYVENEPIFNILNSLGVDYSQGYYFGKPIVL